MTVNKRLDTIFQNALRLPIDKSSKIILMSDCHRGDGSWSDDFAENQIIYDAALKRYFTEGFTYIEIGDGDDLWEYKKPRIIIREHLDTFKIISRFYKENRYYMMFGNHDIRKQEAQILEKFYSYFDRTTHTLHPLLDNIKIYEGIILDYLNGEACLFLVHGHQADFLNYNLWRMSEILVRYLWKNLEALGVKDPVSAAKNVRKQNSVDKKLIEWVEKNNQIMVAGHTHRPTFPRPGKAPYFNAGSSVHPRGITGIEIVNGEISLIKWSHDTKYDGYVFVNKHVLSGPGKLTDFMDMTAAFSPDKMEISNEGT